MPPKKASAPLPKGQASLSSFFGGGGGSARPSESATPSPKKAPAKAAKTPEAKAESPPVTQIDHKITVRGSASPTKRRREPSQSDTANTAEPAQKSKYFDSKPSPSKRSRGASKQDPLVIDDSDQDDVKPVAQSRPTRQTRTSTKRKAVESDSESDSSSDDYKPPIKAPPPKSTSKQASTRKQPADSDSDDDFIAEVKPQPANEKSKAKQNAPPVKAPKPTPKPAPEQEEEKPKTAAPSWRQMAERRAAGPLNPGSKEIPVGKPNCLAGLTLVFTGELSSISRDEASDLAKRYGARITGAPSSKTSYVVVGEGAGPKKLDSIKKNKIPTLDEDGFLNLIASRGTGELDEKTKKKMAEEEKKIKETAKALGPVRGTDPDEFKNALWTTKYAPKGVKELVGNKAAVEKLQAWLHAWPKSYQNNFKKPGPHAMNTYRAVLISGPPGVGKTTSAHLIAKLEGYTPIEFNASDTRSKKLIESMLKETINNSSLDGWYNGGKLDKSITADGVKISDRTVLIMDEVDGMSGGDRGGVGAINALIKKTKVPIICICNDRRNPKMRPFEHTTANLTFRKPDMGAVKSRLLSIAFKEKLKIPGEVMGQLIEAAQGDIRSVINMLSTWKLSKDTMDFDEGKQLGLANAKPGMHTPFSLYSELSSPYMFSHTSRKTLNDKADLYFQDHSFVPLMVAENYIKSRPVIAQREANEKLRSHKHLELLKNAAVSISDGDMIDRMIHGSEQHWSLMPLHAIASSVRPCSFTYGSTEGGFPSFPSWLGQNSKQQRLSRAVVDLQARMRMVISGSRHDVRQHYLPTMFPLLINPLLDSGSDGIVEVINFMDDYYLGVEDRDAILELGVAPNDAEALIKKVPSAVKASFTRKYNSGTHPIAFNKGIDVGGKAKQLKTEGAPDLEDVVEDEEVPEEVESAAESDDDISKDKMVKKPRASAKGKGKAKS